ncbi:hypothetical protein [Vulcanisaeta souniana]|uniref:Uncharacterized protein n=1 Tax=Vulcanisaeta souniana JCM 11219 TaxID=1293586 RepID=A0A830EHV4_9CREN|nr:hypothetical protein [Vulcanisaeta souniana]BDR92260.1 hypothetical protein Vsou_13530 [Vulcanisaeta souniana JCM 11219]GGI86312.1 hypothetical protein GCM10007112_24110 [Vulcanisaeta souniana JCM 11219]
MTNHAINNASPGNAGARYGIVRVKAIIDTSQGIPEARGFIYDPRRGDWVEISEDDAGYIQDNGVLIGGGFTWHGVIGLYAVPRERLGRFRRYVVEWISELPKRPLIVDEGVRVRVSRDEFGNTHAFIEKL